MSLAQMQWTDLVNVPVGSTNFGFTLGSTTGLGQSEGQQDQSVPQHSISFGDLTLLPGQKPVKRSGLFSTLLLALFLPHVSPLTPYALRFTFYLSPLTSLKV